MAFRRTTFEDLGGFDETLRVTWSDVDFCIRARAAGYRVIWTPHAELYHREGATRSFDRSAQDEARFLRERDQVRTAWRAVLPEIGFQSPHLLTDRDQPYLSTRVLAELAERRQGGHHPPISTEPEAGSSPVEVADRSRTDPVAVEGGCHAHPNGDL